MTYISFYKQLDFRSVDCRVFFISNFNFIWYLLFVILASSVRFLFVAFPSLVPHCPCFSFALVSPSFSFTYERDQYRGQESSSPSHFRSHMPTKHEVIHAGMDASWYCIMIPSTFSRASRRSLRSFFVRHYHFPFLVRTHLHSSCNAATTRPTLLCRQFQQFTICLLFFMLV